MLEPRSDIEERVLKAVSEEICVTIADVSRKAEIQKITAKKHLERLKANGILIEVRKIPVRLFFHKNNLTSGVI